MVTPLRAVARTPHVGDATGVLNNRLHCGSRSANSAVPAPFPAGAAARSAGPVTALMAAQTHREARWPQWRPALPPRDDMRASD
jgi:hypothetical protein